MLHNTIRSVCFFILCLLVAGSAFGQGRGDTTVVITDTTNIDALFKKARELSFDGNYTQARRICQKILEKKPNYYDVRTFLGRMYAWEKQYDNARTELSRVLIEKENDYEALMALFDVEFWTESYSVANDYLKVALGYYPTSEQLLIRKAKLQIKLDEKGEAALTLRRILDLNPGQKEAIGLMNSLEGRKLNNNFQITYLVDQYAKRESNQQVAVEVGHNFFFGSLIGRVTYADRFNKTAYIYELESYAHLTKSTYANLLVGFSDLRTEGGVPITIFPKEKYTVELYQKLPKGFEISAGARFLRYSKKTTIYTGSIANYYKDYYFSVRTFITPKDSILNDFVVAQKTSFSINAIIRTYFGDSDNYLGIKGGRGRSPDETVSLDVADFLPSYNIGMEFQRRAFGRWLMKLDMSYAKENINTDRNTYTKRLSTTVTVKTVF